MIAADDAPRADRRLLVAGAGLAGVVLGLVMLATVFGGSSQEGGAALPRQPTPAATATPPPTAPPAPPATPAYVPASRDPFHQNVTVPRAPLASQPAAQAGVTTPTRSTTAPSAPNPTGATATLELKSIAPDGSGTVRATLTVDGRSYRPAKGETFSHGYRLEGIEGNCVEVSAQSTRAQMCLPTTKS